MKKQIVTGLFVGALLSISTTAAAIAGTWQTDMNGWWYSNDDGTWPSACWQWIDGDGDGISECYYFDERGYCLMDTVTPDGNMVNGNGAWIEFGKVKTKTSSATKEDNFTLSLIQREIMQRVLENIIPSVPSYLPDKTENLTLDDINHILYGHINAELYYNPLESDSNLVFDDYTVSDYGTKSFNKYKAFKRIEDLYGQPVREDMLTTGDFKIGDTTISIGGADGDGITDAVITDYHLINGKLYLNVHYTVTYNVSDCDTSGDVTAIFRENPYSFIGFTLESVS